MSSDEPFQRGLAKRTLLSILALSLLSLSAAAQGSTFLSYRAGAATVDQGSGSVNLNEFQLRLPGLKFEFNERAVLSTAVGYHHADMGSVHRFWGDAPMDAFLLEGSLTLPFIGMSTITAGTSVRLMREYAFTDADKQAFHRSALVVNQYRKNGDYFRVGVAYRSGVALDVIPVLGFEGRVSESWDVSALLPGRAYVFRRLGNGNRIGVFGRYQTTPYLVEPGSLGDADILRHRMIRTGLSNETRISSSLVLRIDLSTTVVNDHQWVGPTTDTRTDLDRSIILDAALILRRPRK